MILRFLICSFFIIGWATTIQAQLQKGSWMINGQLRQENYSFPDEASEPQNSFSLLLAPELFYMVTDQLMLGGKLRIGLNGNVERRFAPVRQELLIRHFFKKLDNLYLFYGGELAFSKTTITETGGGSRSFRNRSAYLQSGLEFFLQEAVAVEFLFNYQMIFSQLSSGLSRRSIGGGDLRLEGRLQFFIHPEDKSNPRQTDYRFYPGDWLIGGNFNISGEDFLKPEIHRFWGSGWTTGLRLEAEINVSSGRSALGITPVVRKYFRPEKKGKLWLQAGAGIRGNYQIQNDRDTDEMWWTTASRNLSLEGAIGWSNYISPNFTLDFFLLRKYQKSYGKDELSERQRTFSMGLIFSGLLR